MRAHDSPEHEIASLTARIVNSPSAELFARRAVEWRALGNLPKARSDLETAIALDGHSASLHVELARIEAARQHYVAASNAITRGLNLTRDHAERAAVYMVRAEILEIQGLTELALRDCERAFGESPPAIDCYLTRARLQSGCGKAREAVEGLRDGFEKTGSVVLEIEWIEAMIDAGECQQALQRIEPHLERARWRAAWLIRKARAQLALKQRSAAFENLRAALTDIEYRTKPDRVDLALLATHGLAQALLENRDAARADLERIECLNENGTPLSTSITRLKSALGK
jgi:tetratricopeptide (TPR) repeat protein